MTSHAWLLAHLVAVAALAGLGWVVQLVVYPAFALVGPAEWQRYHARHTHMITRVVGVPWLVQGVSTVALPITAPPVPPAVVGVLALLGLATVLVTVAAAVPAHRRLAGDRDRVAADLPGLLRANLARTLAWTAGTAVAVVQLVSSGPGRVLLAADCLNLAVAG